MEVPILRDRVLAVLVSQGPGLTAQVIADALHQSADAPQVRQALVQLEAQGAAVRDRDRAVQGFVWRASGVSIP